MNEFKVKMWKPNQNGTFSNKTNFHDSIIEDKLFTVEFTEHIDTLYRAEIIALISAAPKLLKAVHGCVSLIESGLIPGGTELVEYVEAKEAINKALNR